MLTSTPALVLVMEGGEREAQVRSERAPAWPSTPPPAPEDEKNSQKRLRAAPRPNDIPHKRNYLRIGLCSFCRFSHAFLFHLFLVCLWKWFGF